MRLEDFKMEIVKILSKDISTAKQDVVKLEQIAETATKSGVPMIRLKAVDGVGNICWYSNWKSVWDKLGFDPSTVSPDDLVKVTYLECVHKDVTYKNFIKLEKAGESSQELPF